MIRGLGPSSNTSCCLRNLSFTSASPYRMSTDGWDPSDAWLRKPASVQVSFACGSRGGATPLYQGPRNNFAGVMSEAARGRHAVDPIGSFFHKYAWSPL